MAIDRAWDWDSIHRLDVDGMNGGRRTFQGKVDWEDDGDGERYGECVRMEIGIEVKTRSRSEEDDDACY